MVALILLLIPLVCFGEGYTPLEVGGSLSLRSPTTETAPTDYQIGVMSDWKSLQIEFEFERENGYPYFNLFTMGKKGIGRGWYLYGKFDVKEAQGIDRQTVIVGRNLLWIGAGATVVSEAFDDPHGALSFWIPLPSNDELKRKRVEAKLLYTTNLNDISILDIKTGIGVDIGQYRPSVMWVYLVDNDKRFWQFKAGLRINLRVEE